MKEWRWNMREQMSFCAFTKASSLWINYCFFKQTKPRLKGVTQRTRMDTGEETKRETNFTSVHEIFLFTAHTWLKTAPGNFFYILKCTNLNHTFWRIRRKKRASVMIYCRFHFTLDFPFVSSFGQRNVHDWPQNEINDFKSKMLKTEALD